MLVIAQDKLLSIVWGKFMFLSRVRQSLRKTKSKFSRLVSVLCLLVFLATACQSTRVPGIDTAHQLESLESESSKVNIVLIQHDSCPWSYFWCAVRQGASDASRNFDAEIDTRSPDRGKYLSKDDADIQKDLFDKTLEECPDAIGITIVDKEKLQDSISYDKETLENPVPKVFCKSHYENDKLPQSIPLIIYNSNSSSSKNAVE